MLEINSAHAIKYKPTPTSQPDQFETVKATPIILFKTTS